MRSLLHFIAFAFILLASPALAIVGGEVARDPYGVRGSVVRIESSLGELCSGAVIGPDLVLTAAHCVLQRATYWVVGVDRGFRQRAIRAIAATMHPDFVAGTTPETQPGIDLAILKLAEPFGPDFAPLDPQRAGSVQEGDAVYLAGFGVVAEGRRGTARTLRQTRLVALGDLQVTNRVLVVADSRRLAKTAGAGACLGDSGGPVFRGGAGAYQLLGIVSWSSGAMAQDARARTACGGLTAVTPVALHTDWIGSRAEEFGRLTAAELLQRPTAPSNAADWVGR